MLETIDVFDKNLVVAVNQWHNPTLDFIMRWTSDTKIWIPFYAFLVGLLKFYQKISPKNNRRGRKTFGEQVMVKNIGKATEQISVESNVKSQIGTKPNVGYVG